MSTLKISRHSRWSCLLLLVTQALLLTLVPRSAAQTANATISGVVTDASSAVLPQASVVVASVDTGTQYKTQTDSAGLYRANNLIPGSYQITVTKDGFGTVVKNGIQLHVGDAISVDLTMAVGNTATQTVTVESSEPLLQTQTSDLSTVVEGRTVQDMPLNGRNPLNLISLVPGVVTQGAAGGSPMGNQTLDGSSNPSGWGNYQIGGGAGDQSTMFIDGAPMNSNSRNDTILVPTQDAISEFRVYTNNVPPAYGRFAGGAISMSTKSGTNAFHGTVYEYIRNKVLNSNNYFNKQAGLPTPNFTQNQYGAGIGGPIKQDKIFFFFLWEGFGLRTAQPGTYTVPTAAERQGDFTDAGAPIYDPYSTTQTAPGVYTRSQFEGCNGNQPNVICNKSLNPTALAILPLFPLPNLPGTVNNAALAPITGGNSNQYNARLDWSLTDRQRLFARYTEWKGNQTTTNPFSNSSGLPLESWNTIQGVIGDTFTLNSSTVIDAKLSYTRFPYYLKAIGNGEDIGAIYGPAYASLSSQETVAQRPVPNIAGVTSFEWANQNLQQAEIDDNYALSASVIKTIGRHTVTVGGEARKLEFAQQVSGNWGGSFNFNSNFTAQNPLAPGTTGLPFASFILGTPASGNISTTIFPQGLQWYGAVYGQDTFELNPRLTLNLGLRWEQPGSMYEKKNRLNVLLLNAPDPLAQATGLPLTGQVALANTDVYPHRSEQLLHWLLFQPRVGFSFKASNTAVVRAGYGISALPNSVGPTPDSAPVNSITTSMSSTLNGGLTPNDTFSDPFPNGILQPIGNNQSRLIELEGGALSAPVPNGGFPYAQQWNLNVEQQLGPVTSLEIGYGGAKGTYLPLSSNINYNQLPTQYNSMGPALLTPVANPFLGVISPTAGQLGTAATVPAGQLLTPHPQYLSLAGSIPFDGASRYDSLQVKVTRHFGAGGTLLAAYTWSKYITNTDSLASFLENGNQGAIQNNYNLQGEKSLSAYDVPQNAIVSYVLDLPVGQGKYLLGSAGGITQALLGRWSVTGITTFHSGYPVALTAQPTTLSSYLGAGTPRPNVSSGCARKLEGAAQSRLGEWFDTSCFTAPSNFGFGNELREDSAIRAAGVANWDFGLYKTLPIHERLTMQFRAEAFNLFNRVQFGPPATALGVAGFGVVTSQINLPRLLQFSLRLNY